MTDTKPTIEERIEAIVHTLELLAEMQAKTERLQAKTERSVNRLGRYVRTIAIDHEARLLALEGDDDSSEESKDQ